MPLAETVEVATQLRVEFSNFLLNCNHYFEVASGDFLALRLTMEDGGVRNHRYFQAVLAFELDFKFPICQSHCFVWIRSRVQFLSV